MTAALPYHLWRLHTETQASLVSIITMAGRMCKLYMWLSHAHTHTVYPPLAPLVQELVLVCWHQFLLHLMCYGHVAAHETRWQPRGCRDLGTKQQWNAWGISCPSRPRELFVRWELRRVRGTNTEPAAGEKAKLLHQVPVKTHDQIRQAILPFLKLIVAAKCCKKGKVSTKAVNGFWK